MYVDEKTREFCQQLDEVLYEKHKDFAENPLLLSMMFLTFMRNSSIPEHLSDFYKKAYDALYSAHDNQDKGCYRRDFECKTLDENEFKRILSHFCFHSYFKEDYEFSEAEIICYLQNSLDKLGLAEIKSADYLTDLRNVVCMIIKDGDIYRFSHRSFQTYFAAYYSAHSLTDEQQKRLFAKILSGGEVYFGKADYYDLLMQIELDRFAENALECGLRNLLRNAGTTRCPDEFLLRTAYEHIYIRKSDFDGRSTTNEQIFYGVTSKSSNLYDFNVLALFCRCTKSFFSEFDDITHGYRSKVQAIKNYAKLILQPEEFEQDGHELVLTFEEIDTTDCITDDKRQHLYNLIIECRWGSGIYMQITKWLDKLDLKRASLESPSFIDDL